MKDEEQNDDEQKKDEQKKKIVPGSKTPQKVKKVDPKHQEEQEKLFSEADKISPVSKKINKVEIVKTIGGDEINLAEYVEENYVNFKGKSTHYFRDLFYYPLADMFGVPRKVMDDFMKPYFVPAFKNAFILSRFPQKVVARIHEKNPYIYYWNREFFHYQVMTKKADADYRLFISQAQEIFSRNPKPTIKEFMKEYCEKYKVPMQLNLFDDLIGK
jgi:hypothetical protein